MIRVSPATVLKGALHGVRMILGESPFWSENAKTLHWVDIRRGQLWRAAPGAKPQLLLTVAGPLSAAIPSKCGRTILACSDALLLLDPETLEVSELVRLPGEPHGNRCNEVKADRRGDLWIGTMDDSGQHPTGNLWRLTRDGQLEKMLSGTIISNTLAWDESRARLYFGDSGRQEIHAFDLDPDTQLLSGQRPFLKRGAAPGVPDGSALDDEACLWNARWDGACLVRVSPEGIIVETIELPVRRPTSCAFGPGNELFVTTASLAPDLADSSLDGAVLHLGVPLGGPAGNEYAGPTRPADICVGKTVAPLHWADF